MLQYSTINHYHTYTNHPHNQLFILLYTPDATTIALFFCIVIEHVKYHAELCSSVPVDYFVCCCRTLFRCFCFAQNPRSDLFLIAQLFLNAIILCSIPCSRGFFFHYFYMNAIHHPFY